MGDDVMALGELPADEILALLDDMQKTMDDIRDLVGRVVTRAGGGG